MDSVPASPAESTAPDDTMLRAKTAQLGEYFSLPAPGEGRWQELPALLDETNLMHFVDRTRAAIASSAGCDKTSIPMKLAASSFQLGIAARLLSPSIGAAVCFGAVPLLTSAALRWQATDHHAPQLATAEIDWLPVDSAAQAARLISESVLTTILRPLNDALRAVMSLSLQVSWGNVSSAANGAVTVLAMSAPQREAAGRSLVRALLTGRPLAGTGSFVGGTFIRGNCCLFYLAPRSGLCGDCVLRSAGGSHSDTSR
ncbi:(2Fe-2S)-binding protein [Mycolicibacterium mengxianglii]|uniref:(2Fe-2S)-binding protein n=1 Tax=Mycolicibacterium mengxianglii TaxID=2736649 RepID=UPI0018EF14B8|nr:(2Fe-2S)-binding protein [Mycolicibacterium mengxianglii]